MDDEEGWQVPSWDAEHADGSRLLVQWGAPGDAFDPLTQTLQRTVSVDVQQAGPSLLGMPSFVSDVVATRLFTALELELLAQGAGLQLLQVSGELGDDVSAADGEADRLVLVFGVMRIAQAGICASVEAANRGQQR
jgi:hypothetical protein